MVIFMEELRRLQLTQLSILKATVKVLNEDNIKYFLIGGSCLGAVRHNGFIPWDDDVDIGIFREDYNKLPEIFKKLPDNMFYQGYFNEVEYPYNFSKVRMKNTTMLQAGDDHLNMHHGIYIDIFALDNAPGRVEDFEKYYNKVKKWKLLQSAYYLGDYKNSMKRKLSHRIIKKLVRTFFSGKKIHEELEKKLLKYMNTEASYVANLCGQRDLKEFERKDVYGEGLKMQFEDDVFIIPEKYDEYLSGLYGNYMEFPPLEERGTDHNNILISFDKEHQNKK